MEVIGHGYGNNTIHESQTNCSQADSGDQLMKILARTSEGLRISSIVS